MTAQDIIVCNGVPKSGTHALLQIAECLGATKFAFFRAIEQEPCYARPISYGSTSIFLSDDEKAKYRAYLKDAQLYKGVDAIEYAFSSASKKKRVVHAHISWRRRDIVKNARIVTVIRNPRDNFLSWLRWFGPECTNQFFSTYRSFLGWRKSDAILYDDLFTRCSIRKLASAIGKSVSDIEIERIISNARGNSLTWTNNPSNHDKQWNEKLDAIWRASNGEELDQLYYAISKQKRSSQSVIASLRNIVSRFAY